MSNTLYRWMECGTSVICQEYPIQKRTACGAWIQLGYENKKFVNLKAHKQYASETPETAWICFLARKRRHLAILQSQLNSIKHLNEFLKTVTETPTARVLKVPPQELDIFGGMELVAN